jgi:hypothetical protein
MLLPLPPLLQLLPSLLSEQLLLFYLFGFY